jgi:hypothetical protein
MWHPTIANASVPAIRGAVDSGIWGARIGTLLGGVPGWGLARPRPLEGVRVYAGAAGGLSLSVLGSVLRAAGYLGSMS